MPERKGSHFLFEDRCDIVFMIREGKSLSAIARKLNVSPSSITREIMRNRFEKGYRKYALKHNHCAKKQKCEIRGLCTDRHCRILCSRCKYVLCNKKCEHFSIEICPRLAEFPYCCNGCTRQGVCNYNKFTYIAKEAQRLADKRLVSSRIGANATPAGIEYTVKKVRELSAQGQSLDHIWQTHALEFYCSVRTFYRHQAKGLFEMTSLEFPLKSRYKKRTLANTVFRENSDFTSRTYSDYLALSDDERAKVVQMDTVEGKRSNSKVLLTLHFVRFHFQIMVLLPDKTQAHVASALDWIESLCEGKFSDIFGLILTDRGTEFIDYDSLEHSHNG